MERVTNKTVLTINFTLSLKGNYNSCLQENMSDIGTHIFITFFFKGSLPQHFSPVHRTFHIHILLKSVTDIFKCTSMSMSLAATDQT